VPDRPLTQRGPADPERGAVEPADLNVTGARWTIAALVGVVALVLAGVAALLLAFGSLRGLVAGRPVTPAGPRLQTDERADRAAVEARSQARLAGRTGGLPIDEAMRRTAALGWDAPR
jgi:hypothetical protein